MQERSWGNCAICAMKTNLKILRLVRCFVYITFLYISISYIRKEKYRPATPPVYVYHAQGTLLHSETGWTGELWSNRVVLLFENLEEIILFFFVKIKNHYFHMF